MILALPASLTLAQAPVCTTFDDVIQNIEAEGGKIVGSAKYDGSATSEMLIVEGKELIVMIGFDAKGCVFGQIVIEAVKPGTDA